MRFARFGTMLTSSVLALSILAGCGGAKPAEQSPGSGTPSQKLAGTVKADGSSTVFPITEAVAEEFQKLHRNVKVTVGVSGTGGGFKQFSIGETDISNASRPIKESEKKDAEANKIEYVELAVAYDGLSVVVNPSNDFVTCLTTAELKKIWEPTSTVKTWQDIRPEWPAQPIKLYGPGTDSGTFDYFTEVINGKSGAIRQDFTASEDDHVLVQGVAGDQYSLGYFGYSYAVGNASKLKLVSIDGGNGCVSPSDKTILEGTYSPLSRPIFIYVNKASLKKPEVLEFVRFYLKEGPKLVSQVQYTQMPANIYAEGLAKVEAAAK